MCKYSVHWSGPQWFFGGIFGQKILFYAVWWVDNMHERWIDNIWNRKLSKWSDIYFCTLMTAHKKLDKEWATLEKKIYQKFIEVHSSESRYNSIQWNIFNIAALLLLFAKGGWWVGKEGGNHFISRHFHFNILTCALCL